MTSKNTLQGIVRIPLRQSGLVLVLAAAGLLAACGPGDSMPKATPTGGFEVTTPDIQAASAKMTIEAAINNKDPEGGATFTPVPPEDTPTPIPASPEAATNTAEPATPTFTLTPTTVPTAVPTAAPTATLAPTATPIPPPTPDQPATATALARELATAVAATLTAAVTPTETPDIEATVQSRMATSVAATLTAQPTPTYTPVPTHTPTPTKTPAPIVDYQATIDARMATSVAATLAAQPLPTVPPTLPPPPPVVSGAAQELQARLGGARIGSRFPNETYAFVGAIGAHINDFQLPTLGITTNSMNDALRRGGAADRANALVNQIWGDWLGDVKAKGLNAYTSDPSSAGLSPFRQLVIRLIQGRQGALVDNQQHGLYNFFTRSEEDHVWYDNVNGVIGAVNRESFLWP